MKFTVRPRRTKDGGGLSVTAMGAREALDRVMRMKVDGHVDLEILDEKGNPYDLVELERLTREGEATPLNGNGE